MRQKATQFLFIAMLHFRFVSILFSAQARPVIATSGQTTTTRLCTSTAPPPARASPASTTAPSANGSRRRVIRSCRTSANTVRIMSANTVRITSANIVRISYAANIYPMPLNYVLRALAPCVSSALSFSVMIFFLNLQTPVIVVRLCSRREIPTSATYSTKDH